MVVLIAAPVNVWEQKQQKIHVGIPLTLYVYMAADPTQVIKDAVTHLKKEKKSITNWVFA